MGDLGGVRRRAGHPGPVFCWPVCVMALVVTAVPVERAAGAVRLVSPSRRAVELLVHAPEAVQAARIGRVRVVEGSVSSATPLMPARSRVWVAQSATPG